MSTGQTAKSSKKARSIKDIRLTISLIALVVGMAIMGSAFLPIMNPPQCDTEIQTGCIVGANIGMGLVLLLGMAVTFLAAVSILLLFLFAFIDKYVKRPRLTKR